MRAKRIPESQICGIDWFRYTFRTNVALADIDIASGKENFGRCSLCHELEEAIKAARRSGDIELLLQKKSERQNHFRHERADKLAYYAHRDLARAETTDLVSCIIDKMDGNKNKCPRYPPPARVLTAFQALISWLMIK